MWSNKNATLFSRDAAHWTLRGIAVIVVVVVLLLPLLLLLLLLLRHYVAANDAATDHIRSCYYSFNNTANHKYVIDAGRF